MGWRRCWWRSSRAHQWMQWTNFFFLSAVSSLLINLNRRTSWISEKKSATTTPPPFLFARPVYFSTSHTAESGHLRWVANYHRLCQSS